jgi:FMN phosphatase YigB (HAD superfamily)
MNKSLLLDIDGVLVRDKALLSHVKDNCVQYVRHKLPDAKDPESVNKILYLAHGHTARGLRNAFRIDTTDFNEKVYDRRLLDHLSEVIYGTEFQKEAEEIHGLVKDGWNVTLFTNSPSVWALPVARAISDEINVHCPHMWLKPEAEAYKYFPNDQDYIFVDDSLKNLGTARWLPNWIPIYFNADDPKDPKLWCPTVGSIWEICLFANSHTDLEK